MPLSTAVALEQVEAEGQDSSLPGAGLWASSLLGSTSESTQLPHQRLLLGWPWFPGVPCDQTELSSAVPEVEVRLAVFVIVTSLHRVCAPRPQHYQSKGLLLGFACICGTHRDHP